MKGSSVDRSLAASSMSTRQQPKPVIRTHGRVLEPDRWLGQSRSGWSRSDYSWHANKTRIVYCMDGRRVGSAEHTAT
jgi:hypothetical protein